MNCETSIIVPNYNNGKYLQACIESILIQDYKNYEIIVIDDNSPDGTKKKIKVLKQKFNNIILINRKYKSGLDTAHKLIFSYAKKNYYRY